MSRADVRDGLTRKERVVLYVLQQTQKERGERNVSSTRNPECGARDSGQTGAVDLGDRIQIRLYAQLDMRPSWYGITP